jgi:hypothetical protein
MGFRPDAAILQEKSVTFLHSFSDQIHNELVLLAPAGCLIPKSFRRRYVDCSRHSRWLSDAQKLRGSIYLADGAVQPSQLSTDGRHVQQADYDSWHVLTVDGKGAVQGCARYRHLIGNVGFDDLGVRESWLAKCEQWGGSLRTAVESEIVRAKQRGAAFSEVGGSPWLPTAWLRFWVAAWGSARPPSGTIPRPSCGGLGGAPWCAMEQNCRHITTLNTGARWKFCDSIRVCRILRAEDGWNS